MRSEQRCESCKWFRREFPEHKAGQCGGLMWIPADDFSTSGCHRGPVLMRSDILPWPITARWEDRILVAADFGCVHHEPKEPPPTDGQI